MSSDPFGRALLDHHRGAREEPLLQCDGEDVREHPIAEFYFEAHDPERPQWRFADRFLSGPLLDLGAGVGRDALYYQERFEVVAVEVSDHLLEVLRDRGVENARRADMFSLRDTFEDGRFSSVLAHGTQVGLSRSMAGLRAFLEDLAAVTTESATVVLDTHDPTADDVEDRLGYRSDPTPGLAYRVMQFEYRGARGDVLLFRLFSPDRLATVADETGWALVETNRPFEDRSYYQAALRKR